MTPEERAAVAKEERERCIKVICWHCANGNEAILVEGVWVHRHFNGKKEYRSGCRAADIRDLKETT